MKNDYQILISQAFSFSADPTLSVFKTSFILNFLPSGKTNVDNFKHLNYFCG